VADVGSKSRFPVEDHVALVHRHNTKVPCHHHFTPAALRFMFFVLSTPIGNNRLIRRAALFCLSGLSLLGYCQFKSRYADRDASPTAPQTPAIVSKRPRKPETKLTATLQRATQQPLALSPTATRPRDTHTIERPSSTTATVKPVVVYVPALSRGNAVVSISLSGQVLEL
jgi:hypothetical protein